MNKTLIRIPNGLFTGLIEVWKDIENYEGIYQVSSFGNIRSLSRFRTGKGCSKILIDGKLMKVKLSKTGYSTIHLRKNGESKHPSIHRLVAKAFLINKENKPTVNHVDGNKNNNNISNLEWSTSAEQMQHAVVNNLVNKQGSAKFTKVYKQEIYNYYHNHDISIFALSRLFSVSERTAGRIVKGVTPRTTTRIKKDGSKIIENILTKEQIQEIKLLRNQGWTFAELSEKFNRGISQMYRIVNDLSRTTNIE